MTIGGPLRAVDCDDRVSGVDVVRLLSALVLALLLAIPILWRAAARYPPAWRWLFVYLAMMGVAAAALRFS